MNDFLAELLDYEIETHHLDFRELPGHQERLERICACHERIQSELGLNFLDQLDELRACERYDFSDFCRLFAFFCEYSGIRIRSFAFLEQVVRMQEGQRS